MLVDMNLCSSILFVGNSNELLKKTLEEEAKEFVEINNQSITWNNLVQGPILIVSFITVNHPIHAKLEAMGSSLTTQNY